VRPDGTASDVTGLRVVVLAADLLNRDMEKAPLRLGEEPVVVVPEVKSARET
jgi:hypothetical protein